MEHFVSFDHFVVVTITASIHHQVSCLQNKNTYTLVYTFIFFGRFVFHLVSKIYLVQSKISKTSSIYPHSDKCHVWYLVAVGV